MFLATGICSAQNSNIKLEWPQGYKLQNLPMFDEFVSYNPRTEGLTHYSELKAAFAKHPISEAKKVALSTAKNPYLRTVPIGMVAQGKILYESDRGTIELIFAAKDEPKSSGIFYGYLVSFDPSGKYIDSILASDTPVSSPPDSAIFDYNKFAIQYGPGVVVVQHSDGGETYTDGVYAITSALKFTKTE